MKHIPFTAYHWWRTDYEQCKNPWNLTWPLTKTLLEVDAYFELLLPIPMKDLIFELGNQPDPGYSLFTNFFRSMMHIFT